MRVFKNVWFRKFATKERISDAALCEAVSRAEIGLVDADLGGGLLKQRVARSGAGRSGGYRTILIFRSGVRVVFVFGYAKNDRANLTAQEVAVYKAAAKLVLALGEDQLDAEVASGRLTEVRCDGQDVQERGDGGRSRDGGGLS